MSEEITANAASDWKSGLNDEFKNDPALADFKDVNSLAKAFKDTKSMVGGMLRVPGEDAGADERSAFQQKLIDKDVGLMFKPDTTDDAAMREHYRLLGMPEAADGYTKIEGMPDERFGQLSAIAHEVGVTDKQFSNFMAKLNEADVSRETAANNQRLEGIEQLKGEWGEAYNEKTDRAAKIVEATKGPENLLKAVKEGLIDAGTVRWLDSLAESLGGEGSQLTKDLGAIESDTRAELVAKRDELTRKIQNERLTPKQHQEALAKLLSYSERLAS